MTFQERTKLAMEKLSKQPPMSYEQKKEQIMRVKQQSVSKIKPIAPIKNSKL